MIELNSERRPSRCRDLRNRNALYCAMCGVSPGDADDLTGQEARFLIGVLDSESHRSGERAVSPVALCSTCYEGAAEIEAERELSARPRSTANQAGINQRGVRIAAVLRRLDDEERQPPVPQPSFDDR
jgi:hypothetical protein